MISTQITNLSHCRSHWSTKFPFYNDTIRSIMSGRRFELLMSYLHLDDITQQPTRSSPLYDKLYKVRPLLDKIVDSFKSPHQHISVDETMIGFKGRLGWIQYMPKKPTKWGIKAWAMADSKTGYVSNFSIYTGTSMASTRK